MDKTNHVVSWPAGCDRVINRLKWLAAVAAVGLTPLLLWSSFQLSARIVSAPLALVPFLLGCGVFMFVWRRWLGHSRLGQFAITLEHESTHALFALLTGHRIVGFRTSMGQGGEVRFTGGGNWLIIAAPYFFPTAAAVLFILAYLLPFPGLPWQGFLLGVALGYHVVSTCRETHKDQSDLQQLGLTFCCLFLPAANLAVIGLLTSFAHGGAAGLSLWLSDVLQPVQMLGSWIGKLTS